MRITVGYGDPAHGQARKLLRLTYRPRAVSFDVGPVPGSDCPLSATEA